MPMDSIEFMNRFHDLPICRDKIVEVWRIVETFRLQCIGARQDFAARRDTDTISHESFLRASLPAAMILEENLEGDALILRAEARYRLKQGSGIRVFSRPERLKEWLESEGLTMESRASLITGAGQIVPGYSLDAQGIAFFVHSPFAARVGDDLIDRNECCLVLQATLKSGEDHRRVLLTSDTTHEVWTDIVKTTRAHGNDARLAWDILKIAHHCS